MRDIHRSKSEGHVSKPAALKHLCRETKTSPQKRRVRMQYMLMFFESEKEVAKREDPTQAEA